MYKLSYIVVEEPNGDRAVIEDSWNAQMVLKAMASIDRANLKIASVLACEDAYNGDKYASTSPF